MATSNSSTAIRELGHFFHRNGYVRRSNPDRRKKEKSKYKKGDEVRLVANSTSELSAIRRLLYIAGFKVAKPFAKGRQFRQPIYGRDVVTRFLAMVDAKYENSKYDRIQKKHDRYNS